MNGQSYFPFFFADAATGFFATALAGALAFAFAAGFAAALGAGFAGALDLADDFTDALAGAFAADLTGALDLPLDGPGVSADLTDLTAGAALATTVLTALLTALTAAVGTAGLPFEERSPATAPINPPTTAPTGPATTLPTIAPATEPAVGLETGTLVISEEELFVDFFFAIRKIRTFLVEPLSPITEPMVVKTSPRRTPTLSMKAFLLCLALLCSSFTPGTGHAAEAWQLVWSDEFDYEGLPDPNKWGYEEGFIRNQEAQFYTRARRENARVENGHLIIEARKEHWANPGGGPVFAEYTSASINTLHKESALYGRLEFRAKLPHGKGVWPAFWTLGENVAAVGWPRCGEIDVMEFVGHDPGWIYGTLHWSRDGRQESSGGKTQAAGVGDAFHVYAVNWDPSRIEFFVDEKRYHSVDLRKADDAGGNPFHKGQYLLLNLALGGTWGGAIDDSALPQQMQVDYVRVFKKKE